MGRGRKNLEEDRGRSAIPRTRTITLEGRGGGGRCGWDDSGALAERDKAAWGIS